MIRAHRDVRLQGESHGMARLTESQVKDIRENNKTSIREMAHIYKMSYQAIWQIKRNRAWKHV